MQKNLYHLTYSICWDNSGSNKVSSRHQQSWAICSDSQSTNSNIRLDLADDQARSTSVPDQVSQQRTTEQPALNHIQSSMQSTDSYIQSEDERANQQ